MFDKIDLSEKEISYQNELAEVQKETVVQILSEGVSSKSSISAVENTMWFAGVTRDKILDRRTPELACKAKCTWCCYQAVQVTAPEAERITAHLNTDWRESKKNRVQQRLVKLAKLTRGKSLLERAKSNLPCAFLEDGKCSIYSVRPLMCARQTSFNSTDCKKAQSLGFPVGSITGEKATKVTFNGSISGFSEALREAAPLANHNALELTLAVVHTLEDAFQIEKWASGEDTMAGCELTP